MEVMFPTSSSVSSSSSSSAGQAADNEALLHLQSCGSGLDSVVDMRQLGALPSSGWQIFPQDNKNDTNDQSVRPDLFQLSGFTPPARSADAELAFQQLRVSVLGSRQGSRRHGRRCVRLDCRGVPEERARECHLAMDSLRDSVLGSRLGTPRRRRRCVLFDLEDAADVTRLHAASGEAALLDQRRSEVLGSRHGTPPRSCGASGSVITISGGHAGSWGNGTVAAEKLPQSSSLQTQSPRGAEQCVPPRSQSCASSALPGLTGCQAASCSRMPFPQTTKLTQMEHCCSRFPSGRGAVLRQVEESSLAEEGNRETGCHPAVPNLAPEAPLRKPVASHGLWRLGGRFPRRAVSEKLPQDDILNDRAGREGTAHGQSDTERRELNRALRSDQGSSPVLLSPGFSGDDRVLPSSLGQSPRRYTGREGPWGALAQRRSSRLLQQKDLGARMTCDEASLQYYAEN